MRGPTQGTRPLCPGQEGLRPVCAAWPLSLSLSRQLDMGTGSLFSKAAADSSRRRAPSPFSLLASDFHPFQNGPLQRKPAVGIPGFPCSHSWVASPCKVDGSADDQDACSDGRARRRRLCSVWPQKPPLQPFRGKACRVHSSLCLPSSVPSSSRSLLPRLSGSA